MGNTALICFGGGVTGKPTISRVALFYDIPIFKSKARGDMTILDHGDLLVYVQTGALTKSVLRPFETMVETNIGWYSYLLNAQLFNFLGNMGYMSVKDELPQGLEL